MSSRRGSGRYFGFVIGGAVPAALAADWLTSAWDQNAGLYVGGPSASVVEQVTREWLVELLGLPGEASIGFVTGTQMAHVTGLAAARFHVLDGVGWDVNRDGLAGAPPVRVIVGEKRHVTVDRALRLLGFGAPTTVAADDQGRMEVDALRRGARRGAGDRLRPGGRGEHRRLRPAPGDRGCLRGGRRLAARGRRLRHLGGGLAAARHLVAGLERADSWTTDAHKWLNVPYDSGIVFCAHPESHRAAMTISASYLIQDEGARRVRDQVDWVPEFSRRARGFAVYAALRSLGRSGLVGARRALLRRGRAASPTAIAELDGVEVLNEVVLNQVLFRFESDERTDEVLRRVQESGGDLAERHDLERSKGDPRLGLELADHRRGDRSRGRAFSAALHAGEPHWVDRQPDRPGKPAQPGGARRAAR